MRLFHVASSQILRGLAAGHLEHDIAPAAVIPQFGLANRGDAAAIQTIPDGNLLVPPVAQPDQGAAA